MKMQMISGWNKKILHWVTDYTRSKVLSPQWPVWPKTSALFFSLSGFHFFLNQSLLQFEDSQWIFYVIFLFWLRTSSVVIVFYFFFSLLLYFSLLWMSWYHWCSISFSSLLTIQHAEKFNLSTKIFKFLKLIVCSHCECLTSFSIKASKFIRSLSFKPKN